MVRWNQEKNHKGRRGGKAKEAMAKKGSKKAREARKEQYAVEKEMREAEGEINNEERERNMTETLKLLFALYFRIVKLDYRSPLLPAALEGLARFAHLVNIDFFRDLLEVLKGIIKRGVEDAADEDEDDESGATSSAIRNDTRERLLCIVTAFELLQGQGTQSPILYSASPRLTALVRSVVIQVNPSISISENSFPLSTPSSSLSPSLQRSKKPLTSLATP